MTNRALLRTGLCGTVIAGICCFTPLLGMLFGVLGLSILMGAWLDFVLLPALLFFAALTGFAALRLKKQST